MDLPELIANIDDLELGSKIGALYADLGEDAIPALADHMEEMDAVKAKADALVEEVKTLKEMYINQSEELKQQKDANTKLMYERLRSVDETSKAEDEALDEIDEAIENIDIYED